MYKQYFKKSNGEVFLFDDKSDEVTDEFTEIKPDEGLYAPIHFDGQKWVGTPYEEWKRQQVEVETPKQDTEIHKDQIIAELSLELIRTQEELNDVRKDISDLTMQLLGGNANA